MKVKSVARGSGGDLVGVVVSERDINVFMCRHFKINFRIVLIGESIGPLRPLRRTIHPEMQGTIWYGLRMERECHKRYVYPTRDTSNMETTKVSLWKQQQRKGRPE